MSNSFQQEINKIIADKIKIDSTQLKESTLLYDELGIDSIEVIDITHALEKVLHIKINRDNIGQFKTLLDIYNCFSRIET